MQQRLLSLDVFRGLTVLLMILVNNPGDWGNVYAPLLHAEWHGCTPTDLVFPFFLFIVGASVVFSINPEQENKGEIVEKIVLRGLKLIALGLFLNFYSKINFGLDSVPLVLQRFIICIVFIVLIFGNWGRKIEWGITLGFVFLCLLLMLLKIGDFGTMRVPGVLQRIGVVYVVVSLLYLHTSFRTQIVVFTILLIGYWFLMAFVSVPNGNVANFEAGKNFANWFDSIVLRGHVWVQTKTWDPEGILSTFPAMATGLAGVFAGRWVKQNRNDTQNIVKGLGIAGIVALIWGLVWNEIFPINKSLWTSSYVLYTAGWASITWAVCYLLFDVLQLKTLAMPFVYFGVNAITVFFGSGLIPRWLSGIKFLDEAKETNLKQWLYQQGIVPFFQNPKNASLAGAVIFLLIWFVVLWVMHRKKVFVKI